MILLLLVFGLLGFLGQQVNCDAPLYGVPFQGHSTFSEPQTQLHNSYGVPITGHTVFPQPDPQNTYGIPSQGHHVSPQPSTYGIPTEAQSILPPGPAIFGSFPQGISHTVLFPVHPITPVQTFPPEKINPSFNHFLVTAQNPTPTFVGTAPLELLPPLQHVVGTRYPPVAPGDGFRFPTSQLFNSEPPKNLH